MRENDTIKLLRELDAGVRMELATLGEVKGRAQDGKLRGKLGEHRRKYEELDSRVREMLDRYGDDGRAPDPIAKGMTRLKSRVMPAVAADPDSAVADIVADCGFTCAKSVSRALNEYASADDETKALAADLAELCERQASDMKKYL